MRPERRKAPPRSTRPSGGFGAASWAGREAYAIHIDPVCNRRLPMGFLQGRRILVTGMLSNRSIAYGIARACAREGAELAFTYQGEGVRERVADLAKEFSSDLVFPCDVSDDAQVDALFASLRQRWDRLDGLVHAIAFAPPEALKGPFHESVTRETFRIPH